MGLLLGIPALLLAFQNCLPQGKSTSQTQQMSGGSGSGYDGKLYAYIAHDRRCADDTPIVSSIQFIDKIPTLIRDNCVDLPPQDQHAVQVELDPFDSSYIVYNDLIFVDTLTRFNKTSLDSLGNMTTVGSLGTPDYMGGTPAPFVARMNSQDKLQWAYTLDVATGFTARGLAVRPDGSVVVVGDRFSAAQSEDGSSVYAMAFSAQGNLLWAKRYQLTGQSSPMGLSAVGDNTGHVYLGGSNFLLKIDLAGEILWQRTGHDFVHLALGPDQSVYGFGYYVSRVSPTGDVMWSRLLRSKNMRSILVTQDGSLVMAGSTCTIHCPSLIVKLSNNGDLVWSKTIKHLNQWAGAALYGLAESPEGFIVSGFLFAKTDIFPGAIYGLSSDGTLQWATEHAANMDSGVYVGANTIRVHGRAPVFAPQYTLKSFFFDLVKSATSVICADCRPFDAYSENYSLVLENGVTLVPSTGFTASPFELRVQRVQTKIEVR